jgi:hypothetical protein
VVSRKLLTTNMSSEKSKAKSTTSQPLENKSERKNR